MVKLAMCEIGHACEIGYEIGQVSAFTVIEIGCVTYSSHNKLFVCFALREIGLKLVTQIH